MALSEIQGATVPVKLWAPIEQVESQALDQLRNIASLPWVAHHVAAMPDVHLGIGATVGSVIAMRGAVCPAAVGVDIGCGMAAVKTSLVASDLKDLKVLRSDIEAAIPVGFSAHEKLGYSTISKTQDNITVMRSCVELLNRFKELTPRVWDVESRAVHQLGTLGGGNHFIELCVDSGLCAMCDGFGYVTVEEDGESLNDLCIACKGRKYVDPQVWLMLHSGSRNIGKSLAEYHMAKARGLKHNEALKDRALAVFLNGTPEMQEYRHDLYWAQDFAMLNREVMLALYKGVMAKHYPQIKFEPSIKCHHNYVAEETHFGEDLFVTRKGAIRAQTNDLGIIPGSMGTKSYIVRGKGNPESFNSASHGAGRRMSRGAAKKKFTVEDLEKQTEGVECRKDAGVIDETPGCYKDIDNVMENQKDLVSVVNILKQVLCVKG